MAKPKAQQKNKLAKTAAAKESLKTEVDSLNGRAFAIYERLPAQGVRIARRAVNLSMQIGYRKGEAQALRHLGLSLCWSGKLTQAVHTLRKGIALARATRSPMIESSCHIGLGIALGSLGQYQSALEHYELALASAPEDAKLKTFITATNNTGVIYQKLGDSVTALSVYKRGLAEVKATKVPAPLLNGGIGAIYTDLKQYKHAERHLNLALAQYRDADDKLRIAHTLSNLGDLFVITGDLDAAEKCLAEARAIAEETEIAKVLAHISLHTGRLETARGNLVRGIFFLSNALEISREKKQQAATRDAHMELARAYELSNDFEHALIHHKAGTVIERQMLHEMSEARAKMITDNLFSQLHPAKTTAIKTVNSSRMISALPGDKEISTPRASKDAKEREEKRTKSRPASPLSSREQEVLGLLSQGKSNKEIAKVLAVSLATVAFHVTGILNKLGASSRTEAVAIALKYGLI